MNLSLSAAMFKGAKLGDQLYNELLRDNHSCALGAAILGEGRKTWGWDAETSAEAVRDWPVLLDCCTCPACNKQQEFWVVTLPVINLIVHLNNDHRWTREAIALWVETLEHKNAAEMESFEHAPVANVCSQEATSLVLSESYIPEPESATVGVD